MTAYLDTETTGLFYLFAAITVIGIYLLNGSDTRLAQLVGTESICDIHFHL
jgi:uncharacterized protein YprB with RNaseH-like and TPR domain